MMHRVNAQFKDGGLTTEVIDAVLPRLGEIIVLVRRERSVAMRVVAIWTPSSKVLGDGLIVVETREVSRTGGI